jgi:hypothetical protein
MALRRVDVVILLVWAVGGGLYSSATFSRFDRRFFTVPIGNDVWFEADMPVVAQTMMHRWGDQGRNAHHPLFALATTVPTYGLRAFGVPEQSRLAVIVGLSAAVWSATIFALIRLVTPTRVDACVFTLLTHVSAAAVFWLPTIETVVLGSATLLVPLALLAADDRRRAGDVWYVAASAVSLSMTATSWIAGIAAAVSARRLRTALQITANALVMVVVLWGVQKTLVPGVPFFIEAAEHSRFMFSERAGGLIPRGRALLLHSVVMPQVQVTTEPKWGGIMSVQRAAVGSSGLVGRVATLLWTALLGAGVWTLSQRHVNPRLRGALLVTLAGQSIVYLCYGEETFLYSLYVTPLLVVCAAAATNTSYRRWITTVAAILIVLLALNNARAFSSAADFFNATMRAGAGPS